MGRALLLLALSILCYAVHGQQQAQEAGAVPAVATLTREPSVLGTAAAAAADQLTGKVNVAAVLVASSDSDSVEGAERPEEEALVEDWAAPERGDTLPRDSMADDFPGPHPGPWGPHPHPHHKGGDFPGPHPGPWGPHPHHKDDRHEHHGYHHHHHHHHHRKSGKDKELQPPFPCPPGGRMPGPPPCRPPFPCLPPPGVEEPPCGPPFPHHRHHHDREEHHKWSEEERSWWQSMGHSIEEFADEFEFDLDDFDDDGWVFLGVVCLGLGAAAAAAWITYCRRVRAAQASVSRSLAKLGNDEEKDPLMEKQHSGKVPPPCPPPFPPPPPGPPPPRHHHGHPEPPCPPPFPPPPPPFGPPPHPHHHPNHEE